MAYLLQYNNWHCTVPDAPSCTLPHDKYNALCRFIYFLDTSDPAITPTQATALLNALNKSTYKSKLSLDPNIHQLTFQYSQTGIEEDVFDLGHDHEIITRKILPGVSDSTKIAIVYLQYLQANKFFSLGFVDDQWFHHPSHLQTLQFSFAQALGIPQQMRGRVVLTDDMVRFIMMEFDRFLNTIRALSLPWNNFGRYSNKNPQRGHHPYLVKEDKRAFLIYTKLEAPNTFFIIIKSQTRIRQAPKSELGIMFGSGSTKSVKINGLLITIVMPLTLVGTSTSFNIEPIVPFARLSDPPDMFVYQSHAFQRKADHVKTLLGRQQAQFDFYGWDDFLMFQNPTQPKASRLICYQKKVGTRDCEEPATLFNTWTAIQKVRAICSILCDLLRLLLKGILPIDLKFANMRIDESIAKFPKLLLIDFTGFGTTYSLFKGLIINGRIFNLPIPAGTDDRNHNIRLFHLSSYLYSLNKLNRREPIDDMVFQRIIYQLFFEIIFNIFFILNPNLIKTYYESSWGWNFPPETRAAMQAWGSSGPLQNLLCKSRLFKNLPWENTHIPFKNLLIRYTFDQNFDHSIQQIALNFIGTLQIELNNIILTAGGAGALQPDDLINPTFAGSPLNSAWINDFVHAIEKFRTTPSPFQPIKIRHLTMI